MYRPVDLIEVRAWGATVGGVSIDPGLGYYVFEYDPKWQARGIELAPLTMPVSQSLHVFPLLPEATYKRLPGDARRRPARRLRQCVDRRLDGARRRTQVGDHAA
jgi:hypothetical protein